MNRSFSLFEVFMLIGLTQGFVIAFLILANRKRSVSKLLLSFVLLVFNLLCVRILILTTGLWQTTLLKYFPLPFELAIQPLMWLYTLSLVKPDFKLGKTCLYHFIPFGISFVYSVLVYGLVMLQPIAGKDVVANSLYFNDVKRIEDYFSIVSSVLYWALGLRLVLTYRRWVDNNISNTDYPTYAWLRNISLLMGILILVLATDIILDYFFHFGFNSFAHWRVFFVYLAALIYYLGFKGFQLPDKKNAAAKTEELQAIKQIGFENNQVQDVTNVVEKPKPVASQPETETGIDRQETTQVFEETAEQASGHEKLSKLTDEKALEIKQAVTNALAHKELYLDPELSLNKLAKAIRFPAASVSYVINNHFKKSFRNLVNEYRVAEVKERLADPKSGRYSILGVAYECGFNSEASFYRIFKSIAGVSPKEYHKSLQPPA